MLVAGFIIGYCIMFLWCKPVCLVVEMCNTNKLVRKSKNNSMRGGLKIRKIKIMAHASAVTISFTTIAACKHVQRSDHLSLYAFGFALRHPAEENLLGQLCCFVFFQRHLREIHSLKLEKPFDSKRFVYISFLKRKIKPRLKLLLHRKRKFAFSFTEVNFLTCDHRNRIYFPIYFLLIYFLFQILCRCG